MSLKSIRESYSRLLTAFADAGVKLNESQKADLDTFIVAIESKMSKQKEATIKATKKIVESHLEKEYKKVFESILKHQQKNAELAAKVQDKITKINESKKVARKVSNYLDLYVESVLPKKTVVDYDRMNKLETVFESLKDTLLINEESVEAKKTQLAESFNKDKKLLETQIAKLQVKLNESMAKTQKLNNKIDQFKAMELLESKTKDLPTYEARQIKKRLAGASTVEIEKTFGKILESVKDEMQKESDEDETTLEAEVKDIIENDGKDLKEKEECDEDDILKGRKHNGHLNEKDDEECDESDEEETYETLEQVKMNEDGDIELDESEVIGADEIKMWSMIGNKIK